MSTKGTILVTGGAGYIGSVCTEHLLKSGYYPVVIDNLKTGHRKAVHPNAEFIKGDIGNKSLLTDIFAKYKPGAVIHFAAETLVEKSVSHPHQYFFNNLSKGLTLLDAMTKAGCLRIVFSSTAAVYGEVKTSPIKEDHIPNPINSYGESKLMFEKFLRHFSTAHKLQYLIFRYFNAAGATLNYGEDHAKESHLIPIILQVALGKRKEISIFGTDYDSPDGTCIRDYVHVTDIAVAHVLALKKIGESTNSVYNLGHQTGASVKQVIKTCETITRRKIPIIIGPRRAGDPSKLVADSKKARSELGWNPKHSSLESIVSSSWKWARAHPSGYAK